MTLEAILAGLRLPADPAQLAALETYLDLLSRWNATFNLTAVRERAAMLTQHLADCLAVVPALQRFAGDGPFRLLDVGSGGGLPGVVIATMMPGCQVTCVDAVGKKVAFVRQVAAVLPLSNLRAQHARIEDLGDGAFDVITSRAFSSLSALVQFSHRLLEPEGAWMAMKGKVPADEAAALPPGVEVFHVEQLQVPGLDAQRCLVWMRIKVEPASTANDLR